MKCVSTGVKHLHHAAERYNVGVYFEANGHGTVLFSQPTIDTLAEYQPSTPAQSRAVEHLVSLTELINQTVGDALSDMLFVEVVLSHKSYNGEEWDSLYVDLPNRLAKVSVPNRNAFKTEDAERRLVSPDGLQSKIDDLVNRYQGGRSFVRPSGTEDVVRVYAEAALRAQADGEFFVNAESLFVIDIFSQSLPCASLAWFTTKLEEILLAVPKNFCNLIGEEPKVCDLFCNIE